MSPYNPQTNFIGSDGTDLGKKLVTKDYFLSVYPDIANQNGFSSGSQIWGWGFTGAGSGMYLGINDSQTQYAPAKTPGNDWKQLSGSAAIKTDGTLWVWGGASPKLGTNSTSPASTPVTTFAGGTDWKIIKSSSVYTAAIKTDGTLWVWGFNNQTQLGTNDTQNKSTPVTTFAGGTNWKTLATNTNNFSYTMHAIKTDGTLWSWGNNSIGLLGVGDTITRSTPITTFVGGTDWKFMSGGGVTGQGFIAAIKTDGTLWTWGNTLFNTNTLIRVSDTRVPVTTFSGGTDWANTATGAPEELNTICGNGAAIKTNGTLWTWGVYLVGNNTVSPIYTPVTTFSGGTNWKQVDVSGPTSWVARAAIKTDGTLWTWGNNTISLLGNNGFNSSATPITTFAGGANWKQVSITNFGNELVQSMAAVKTDGTLWAWGSNYNGQLGINSTILRISTPITTFAGGGDWKQVSSGAALHLGIKINGTLWAWGSNLYGQLGLGTNDTNGRSTPVTTLIGGTDWKQVSCKINTVAAIKTDGTLWTWGNGGNYILGNGSSQDSAIPITTFAGGTDWKQVSASNLTIAAIKTDGTLWVWGNTLISGASRLGTASTPITTFVGGADWAQVDCGASATSALKTDGTLWVWGNWDSYPSTFPLNLSPSNLYSPGKEMTNSTNWSSVCCSGDSGSALKTDGTLWVWGNYSTTLGVSTSVPATTFAGGSDWKSLFIGDNPNIFALKTDGTLWGWGYKPASPPWPPVSSAASNYTTPIPLETFSDWRQLTVFGSLNAIIMGIRDVV